MRKLSVKPRRISGKIPAIDDGIAFDDQRRLRNALIALAALDPGWMIWVERCVPSCGSGDPHRTLRAQRVVVERQARSLMMQNYSFFGRGFIQGVIDSDFHFTDDGNLKGHL